MTRKESIRIKIRALRAALNRRRLHKASGRIQRAVLNLPEWSAARRVALYLALPQEVETRQLLVECWKTGKQILVPVYRATTGNYCWARLQPDNPIKKGHFSVPEPEWPRYARGGADLVVTPGLAFDRRGGRLGHGRGYYDRLLSKKSLAQAFKVGLALEGQMVARVPMSARDIRLDAIVTERSVYRCK